MSERDGRDVMPMTLHMGEIDRLWGTIRKQSADLATARALLERARVALETVDNIACRPMDGIFHPDYGYEPPEPYNPDSEELSNVVRALAAEIAEALR
jgi:hypothetical protein